jgi:pimeloyl-ACP methyl ester carboxylesterase
MALAPFEQMRFEDLPERPRRPHPFFDAPRERVTVSTPHFGSIELAMRRFGRGPKLVLIHGLMTSSYSWRYVLEPLGEHFELYAPDLPGAGESQAPDVTYGPRELADLIAAFVSAVDARGAPMIGNSMGGYLAMWMVLRHPTVISRLVNLHSPGIVTPRMSALELALGVPLTDKLLDHLVRRDPLKWAFKNVHYYDESLKSREEAREYALDSPAKRRAFHHYLHDTMSAATMKELAASVVDPFPVPLLLTYARRDPMVPPEVGARLAELIKSATFTWLEEGSHFAHVDAPKTFLAAALPFLQGK